MVGVSAPPGRDAGAQAPILGAQCPNTNLDLQNVRPAHGEALICRRVSLPRSHRSTRESSRCLGGLTMDQTMGASRPLLSGRLQPRAKRLRTRLLPTALLLRPPLRVSTSRRRRPLAPNPHPHPHPPPPANQTARQTRIPARILRRLLRRMATFP